MTYTLKLLAGWAVIAAALYLFWAFVAWDWMWVVHETSRLGCILFILVATFLSAMWFDLLIHER